MKLEVVPTWTESFSDKEVATDEPTAEVEFEAVGDGTLLMVVTEEGAINVVMLSRDLAEKMRGILTRFLEGKP